MNKLNEEKKVAVLAHLVEGMSIRSIERITGIHRDTICRLLVECGEMAKQFQDEMFTNLQSKQIQVDEIWTYVAKKQKYTIEQESDIGDQYVFVALDADTKIVPTFTIGKRTIKTTHAFMSNLSARIQTRFQLSTDSFNPYFNVVDSVWGNEIDYGQIQKNYGEEPQVRRYSPGQIIGVTIKKMIGKPVRKNISTSFVERQNLTMRMSMRRFTRLTNAFSKKLKNLECAVALHFFHYNFMRVHKTLRVTPAMEAKIVNRIFDWNDLLNFNSGRIAA